MEKKPKIPGFLFLLPFLLTGIPTQAQHWEVQTNGIDTNLRGVSAANISGEKGVPKPVVWASGSNGVILKSLDEGKTWQRLHVEGGETLDFRGIVAFDDKTAYLMSSGEGEKSRIYKTTDGGEIWKLQAMDKHKEFFLDSIACLSRTHCFALGDPIGGKFLVLSTNDGERWSTLAPVQIPAALPGEGAFAASNSCLLVSGEEIFFVTGGPTARVFLSKHSGTTWGAVDTRLAHANASSGAFSVALSHGAKAETVVVVGGDYQKPDQDRGVAAFSKDGGRTWKLSKQQTRGFRSAVALLDGLTFIAVGPSGEDISEDGGVHWRPTHSLNLNAVAILDKQTGWAVGPHGMIARMVSVTNPK